jgi:hypothetical protein
MPIAFEPTGYKYLELNTGLEKTAQQRRCRQQVLKVVDEQQHRRVHHQPEVIMQCLGH